MLTQPEVCGCPISDLKTKTFLAWLEKFTAYLKALPGGIIHVVFDNYDIPTDKPAISKGRTKRGKERNFEFEPELTPVYSEWEDFLTNDANKLQLKCLLPDHLLSCRCTGKIIYATKGDE